MSVTKAKSDVSVSLGLSLAAGILILISGIIFSVWHFAFFPSMSSMMGSPLDVNVGVLSIGIITCGAIIIGASIMMYKIPSKNHIWGVFVITFSIISIFEMGGFLIGGIIGIIGGALAFKDYTGKKELDDLK